MLGMQFPEHWSQIQEKLGLCPQHSVLYPDLTTGEHLVFYGHLKGLEGRELEAEVDRLLRSMDMEHVRDQQVKTLSEGMQRRICVSVAFIGNSQVVILDEPTAGVDPVARLENICLI